jgi:hypothetical protein
MEEIMKKIVSIMVAIVVMFTMSVPVFADVIDSGETSGAVMTETTYLSDGSYCISTIEVNEPGASASGMSLLSASATSTKTASKKTTYYNGSDEVMWYVMVTGTFTYNGSTSTCTSSVVTAAAPNSYWKIASKSASKSGNQAVKEQVESNDTPE